MFVIAPDKARPRLSERESYICSVKSPHGLSRTVECGPLFRDGLPWHARRDVQVTHKPDGTVILGINVHAGAPISCLEGEFTSFSPDEAEHIARLLLGDGVLLVRLDPERMKALSATGNPEHAAHDFICAVLGDDAAAHAELVPA